MLRLWAEVPVADSMGFLPFAVSVSNRERRLAAQELPFDRLRANDESHVAVVSAESTESEEGGGSGWPF